MDATLRGYPLTQEAIQRMWEDVCTLEIGDDVSFSLESVSPIREEDEYGGYRVAITAHFETIKTPVKVDITTGDVITPGAVRYAFPSSFESKQIPIWAYNLETILAEKVETVLRRSVLNTRPRDYYDIYILVKTYSQVLDIALFRTALEATAKKRETWEAIQEKDEIVAGIRTDPTLQQRWKRYSQENSYAQGIPFEAVLDALVEILH